MYLMKNKRMTFVPSMLDVQYMYKGRNEAMMGVITSSLSTDI